jgi:hypothetical protein
MGYVKNSVAWSATVMDTRICKDPKTGKFVPVPVTYEGALRHSLRRALQAYQCVRAALTVDEVPSVYRDLSDEDRNRYELELVEFYTKLDLQDTLLPFLKEQSCYTSAVGFGQTETNVAGATQFCEKIKSLGSVQPGNLGPAGWVTVICESIRKMGPHALGNFSPMFLRHRQRCLNVCFLKRGLPCLEDWDIDAKLYGHRYALGSKHPDKTPRDPAIRESVKVCLAVLARECFGGARFCVDESLPSLNACFEAGRKLGEDGSGGGAMAYLVQALDSLKLEGNSILYGTLPLSDESSLLSLLEELTSMPPRPTSGPLRSATTILDRMVEDPTCPGRIHELRIDVSLQEGLRLFTQQISECAFRHAMSKSKLVEALPSAVPEPCKARIVTAGEAFMYQRALCIQKFMHNTLRKISTFRLIGEPVTETNWDEMYPPDVMCELLLNPDKILVSGDYKAATDNLNPELSEFCWAQISANVLLPDGFYKRQKLIDSPWFDLGRKCLTGHRLWYESRTGAITTINMGSTDGFMEVQQWGQLMGSPMSFPILNMINACSTCVAMGWTPQSGSVLEYCKSLYLQTNGDDIAFVADKSLYPVWQETVTACGLEPSLGKNYTSREFIQINSEFHVLHPVSGPATAYRWTRPHSWKLMSFLNLPILFGMEAKGPMAGKSVLDQTPFYEVGPLARSLTIGCDSQVALNRSTAFQAYWLDVLKRAPAGCIWEGCQALGGLGLPRTLNPFEPPHIALHRTAYLSCLDTRKRLQAVTPPQTPTSDPVGAVLKQSMRNCSVTVDRVVSKTFMDDDNLAVRLRPKGGCDVGALLAHFIHGWSAKDDRDNPETTPRLLRVAAECRYRRLFVKVSKLALKSSLCAMSPQTLLGWSDHRTLEKLSMAPQYDRRVRLVGLSSLRRETL